MDADFTWAEDFLDDAMMSAGALALSEIMQAHCGMAPREADKAVARIEAGEDLESLPEQLLVELVILLPPTAPARVALADAMRLKVVSENRQLLEAWDTAPNLANAEARMGALLEGPHGTYRVALLPRRMLTHWERLIRQDHALRADLERALEWNTALGPIAREL